MIDVRQLRYGCHVLVGRDYPTFSVPKRVVTVTDIGYEDVEVADDPQQNDRDVYNVSEIEGIAIADIIPILEKNGFHESGIKGEDYTKTILVSKNMIKFDLYGNCSCFGSTNVVRSGVKYLHQLEACISDAGINFEFTLSV